MFHDRGIRLMRKFVIVCLLVSAVPLDAHSSLEEGAHSGNDEEVDESIHAGYWPTNGCTAVRDSVPLLYYFEHACDHHDGCYRWHWWPRGDCDSKFRSDMTASCNHNWSSWNPARYACQGVRNTFYRTVQLIGGFWYGNSSISLPLE